MADSLAARLEHQVPGFKASFGGEELKKAASALAGGVEYSFERRKDNIPALPGSDDQPKKTETSGATTISAVLAQTSSPDASESDLVLRELALAANQYLRVEAAAGPSGQDYEVVYNHGLVLQELAGKLHSGPEEQLKLLEQACELYASAAAGRPSSHAVLYNWGVALSDMARLLRDTRPGDSLSCLHQASHKYAESLDLQPGNPQALNNWGLVLQEMSSLAQSSSERDQLVSYALEKFRHAIRLRSDFDRGCYNLGTVLYTYACAVQAELTTQLKVGRLTSQDAETSRERNHRETRARCLFTAAAQYICLAAALQPSRDIYRRSLAVVKPMLPLPFLRAGYLTAPLEHTLGGPAETWRREWFVLDHVSLRSASALESSLSNTAAGGLAGSVPTLKIGHAVGEVPLVVPLDALLSVRRCNDPSLPEGEALWLQLSRPLGTGAHSTHAHDHVSHHHHHAQLSGDSSACPAEPWAAAAAAAAHGWPTTGAGGSGGGGTCHTPPCAPPCCCVWLVADDADSADAWADALMLAHHVVASRSPGALEEALTPPLPGGGGGGTRVSGGGGPKLAGYHASGGFGNAQRV